MIFDMSREDESKSSGVLTCEVCHTSYPVINHIPRLIPQYAFKLPGDHTASCNDAKAREFHQVWHKTQFSFGRQWLKYDVQAMDEDRKTFENKTGFPIGNLAGIKVLDAGCGGGRYAFVTGTAGATVFAADISPAVEKTLLLCKDLPHVNIVQANLMALPFHDRSFDLVYSIGVLHHTPDTRKAFESLLRYLKPGGVISIWLYPKWSPFRETMNQFWRSFTTRMPHFAVHVFSKMVSPFGAFRGHVYRSNYRFLARLLWQTEKFFPGISNHPDPRQRICDTFDWLTPQYQWHHTDTEVREWFESAGLVNVTNLSERYGQFHTGQGEGVCFSGQKPSDSASKV